MPEQNKRRRLNDKTEGLSDAKSAKKGMPVSYTASQKQAIAQFVAFTQADKTTAAKILKQHNWNVESAANSFFSGGNHAAANPHKAPLNKLFDSYRDDPKNEPDEVNMEGMMKMLGDMDISVESVGLLIFSEAVSSPSLGKVTREGFVDGLTSHGVSDKSKIRNVVLRRQGQLADTSSRQTLKSVYKHTFVIARAPGQKSLALEAAIEYWKVVLAPPSLSWSTPQNPWLDWWIEFLQARWKRSVNKDMWDQTLTFAEKTLEDESLKWWSEDSAWPGVIDEFVEFVQKEKRQTEGDAMEVE